MVGDRGVDGQGGGPGGGAGLVLVVALLEGPNVLPLKPQRGFLPLRLHFIDESPG